MSFENKIDIIGIQRSLTLMDNNVKDGHTLFWITIENRWSNECKKVTKLPCICICMVCIKDLLTVYGRYFSWHKIVFTNINKEMQLFSQTPILWYLHFPIFRCCICVLGCVVGPGSQTVLRHWQRPGTWTYIWSMHVHSRLLFVPATL